MKDNQHTFSDHLESLAAIPPPAELCKCCHNYRPPYSYGICDKCTDDQNESDKLAAFQKALNELPSDVVITFNLMVATYYEGLANKEDCGDNIATLVYVAREAMESLNKK